MPAKIKGIKYLSDAPKTKHGGKNLAKLSDSKKYNGSDNDPETLNQWKRRVETHLRVGEVHPDSYLAMAYIHSFFSGQEANWFGRKVMDEIMKTYPN